MIPILLFAAVVVLGLAVIKRAQPAAPAAPGQPASPASPATLADLAGEALAGVEGVVGKITDEVLSLEYARRVKQKADLIKTQAVLKNLHENMLSQFTPVTVALPAAVNEHPASQLASNPPSVPNP